MFCTPTDFDLIPYNIPNLNLVVNTFQEYIDKKEKQILKRLLGAPLYVDFIEGREALPAEWDVATQYVIGDHVVYGVDVWQSIADNVGVVPSENASWTIFETGNQWLILEKGSIFYLDGYAIGEWLGLVDMLIPYIFYSWLRDTWDNNTGIGVVQSNAENSEKIAPSRRLVDSWNEFAIKATAMQYMIAAANVPDEIYLDWLMVPVGSLNTFNL